MVDQRLTTEPREEEKGLEPARIWRHTSLGGWCTPRQEVSARTVEVVDEGWEVPVRCRASSRIRGPGEAEHVNLTWLNVGRPDPHRGPEPRQHRVGNLSTEDGMTVLRARLTGLGLAVAEDELRTVAQSTKGLLIHLEVVSNLAAKVVGDGGALDPALLHGSLRLPG